MNDQAFCTWDVELSAGVEAADARHALILVALDLLTAAASADDDTVSALGPVAPSNVLHMNFSVGRDE